MHASLSFSSPMPLASPFSRQSLRPWSRERSFSILRTCERLILEQIPRKFSTLFHVTRLKHFFEPASEGVARCSSLLVKREFLTFAVPKAGFFRRRKRVLPNALAALSLEAINFNERFALTDHVAVARGEICRGT